MANEVALVTVNGNAIMETELIAEAVAFATTGYGGKPVTLPKNYDLTRAIKNFCFALPTVKNIEIASKESVYKAVHEYVTKGYDVGKQQCALIVREDKDKNGNSLGTGQLTVQREYFGQIARTKRERPDIKDISHGTVIYAGEKVALYNDAKGRLQINHEMDFGCWGNEIAGAYAIATYMDGSTEAELVPALELKAAWAQGGTSLKVHKSFPSEMARKTAINRLCKKLLNESDDSSIMENEDERQSAVFETVDAVDIDAEEVDSIPATPSTPESSMTAIPEPKEVTAPPEQPAAPQPKGNPEDEDYCITIGYKEYKNNYADCVTGAYNNRTKMIEVYPNQKKAAKKDKDGATE
ncbi:MAG: recombinase RecT [Clostridia bacterium]|nr:recombinase RecT [Clostridia bacterium]